MRGVWIAARLLPPVLALAAPVAPAPDIVGSWLVEDGEARVEVAQASNVDLLLMFDPGHSLDERILSEQFRY